MTSQSKKQVIATRPLAVWFALAIIILYFLLFIIVMFIGPPDQSILDQPEFIDQVIGVVETLAIEISLGLAIWALATRRLWGRWFIIAPVGYILGTIGYGLLVYPDPDPVIQQERIFIAVLGFSPLAFATLLVSFGERNKEYFKIARS